MRSKQRVHFRLIQMPCCGQALCWVNPRLPNYCPECGKFVFADLKAICPENIVVSDEHSWLTVNMES
jgi:hypothetical protein